MPAIEHDPLAPVAYYYALIDLLGLPDWIVYAVVRDRNRRRIGFHVEFDGRLVVTIPYDTPALDVAKFVRGHRDKIAAAVGGRLRAARPPAVKTLVDGERFFLLGSMYELHLVDGRGPAIESTEPPSGRLYLRRDRADAATLIRWYIAQSRAALPALRRGLPYDLPEGTAVLVGTVPGSTGRFRHRTGVLVLDWSVFQHSPFSIEQIITSHLADRVAGRDHAARDTLMDRWLPRWRGHARDLKYATGVAWRGEIATAPADNVTVEDVRR